MALSIKSEKADELARKVARLTGTTLTEAVEIALEEKLKRTQSQGKVGANIRRLMEEFSQYPVLDDRSADEIIGYDEFGLPN